MSIKPFSTRIVSSDITNPTIRLPGSKYLTNRYIALAAVTDGKTILRNAPDNDDIQAALKAIESLGASVSINDHSIAITGFNALETNQETTLIDCRDSGTLSRFITAVAATSENKVIIDASQQMRTRPMQEAVESLQQLDVEIISNDGFLPIELQGPIKGGRTQVDASRSSQFLSGLLIACLKAKKETLIQISGDLVSKSYIDLTLEAISKFSGKVEVINNSDYLIPANQKLIAPEIDVASDPVSCSYFMVAALIAKSSIRIQNYDFNSVQGESKLPEVLKLMGANIESDGNDLLVSYQQPLKGVTVDMGNMPDAVPTLAVLAAFVNGETHITNIAHLAFKESNRIIDLCEQLKKVGVICEYGDDFIKITGGNTLKATNVSSCHDHRLAMSLALVGIRLPKLVIEDAQAVEKSFPLYWQYLKQIGIAIEKN